MALVTSVLLGLVSMAHGADDRLVTCQQPVDVRFIAKPGQEKAEFSEEVAPGQKHWWSYGCKLSDIVAGPDTRPVGTNDPAQERKLFFHSNWYWHCEAYNLSASMQTSNWIYNLEGAVNCTHTTTTTTTTATTATTTTAADTTTAASGNATNGTNSTTAAAVGTTTKKKGTKEAEVSGSLATAFNSLIAGLSLSLPFAMADDAQIKKKDRIDVLLPCSSLIYPLKDLDGDGQLDCKMTKEQSYIATIVPALEGNWKVAAAHTVAHGRRLASPKHQGDNITLGDGAMCVDIPEGASWTYAHEKEKTELLQSLLPTAIANVAGFTHNGKRCEEDLCEASMWSFDLTYPSSACTPELPGWVRPCTAKMMPNGQLVLIRGASATAGTIATRPPLMEDIESAHDVLPFANGLAAAAQSEFDVLVLQKEGYGRHKAFVEGDVDANGALSFSEFEAVINKLPEHCASAF